MPGQNVWSVMPASCGVGFTVTVNCVGVPVQELAEGVTVTVELTGRLVLFVAVNVGIFPLPVDASPIPELVLAHVKVLPVTSPSGTTAIDVAPLHKVWLPMGSTVGTGFTIML